jgi:hypothetical protein
MASQQNGVERAKTGLRNVIDTMPEDVEKGGEECEKWARRFIKAKVRSKSCVRLSWR